MGADGDLCDLVHGPASRVQSEPRGTRVHVARSAEPEPELEPELAGSGSSWLVSLYRVVPRAREESWRELGGGGRGYSD